MQQKQPLKLYTKTGDKGESGLADGQRLSKSELIFEVLGTIDELNSNIGFGVIEAKEPYRQELLQIQDYLMIIASEIAGSKKVALEPQAIRQLEKRIDVYQQETRVDWFTKFLLPGGTEMAGRLDLARTVCRRLERLVVRYSNQGFMDGAQLNWAPQVHTNIKKQNTNPALSGVPAKITQYLNRLSDYLFALRCFVNSQAGYEEKEFHPKYLDALG